MLNTFEVVTDIMEGTLTSTGVSEPITIAMNIKWKPDPVPYDQIQRSEVESARCFPAPGPGDMWTVVPAPNASVPMQPSGKFGRFTIPSEPVKDEWMSWTVTWKNYLVSEWHNDSVWSAVDDDEEDCHDYTLDDLMDYDFEKSKDIFDMIDDLKEAAKHYRERRENSTPEVEEADQQICESQKSEPEEDDYDRAMGILK